MTSRHRSWFASAPAKKTSAGPWPDDCQATGPSRVSSIPDSMSIKHPPGMREGQGSLAGERFLRLLPRVLGQAAEHRLDRGPECRLGHVGVVGAGDEQPGDPRQAADEIRERVRVKLDELATRHG